MKPTFDRRLNGKLLLTAEYFVLDGVPALAVPTRYGQELQVLPEVGEGLFWRAAERKQNWFMAKFSTTGPEVTTDDSVAKRLWEILTAADELRPGALGEATEGNSAATEMDFDRAWGLGSSSTLIAGVAAWLNVDPYALLERTFGGSGYDLACAVADGPLVYTRAAEPGGSPGVEPVDWRPDWTAHTYFVYRNRKQNSREGIAAYRSKNIGSGVKDEVGQFTTALLEPALHPRAAAQILKEHEHLVGATLRMTPVQEEYFGDFPGQIKSLGAWGGDFIWAVSERPGEFVRKYFNERGLETVIPYGEMVL